MGVIMKNILKTLTATCIIAGSVVTNSALASSKAAVIDTNNNVIKSKLSKECVRTKWDAANDVCAPEAPKPVLNHTEKKQEFKIHKRSYLTFFDFDKSNLTENANEVLSKLAGDVKSARYAYFEVTGHTDRVGSDRYNLSLSEKRALTVRNKLINQGFNPKNIKISWKGESEPLVSTNDGIKEPQNRRVEIKVTTKQ